MHPGNGQSVCWRDPFQKFWSGSSGGSEHTESGKGWTVCRSELSAVKDPPSPPPKAAELSPVSLWKEPPGGQGGLSGDLAFWPEDSGILGGCAEMSLREKLVL